ncbi:NitT/TauT family transport system ATP-binding protein [termite gut metagenome]|uniref:NitT/TauT family transport system ATP-binding protein n=1 Tax=termite gut metagenome TaxID=433724 RepID=A0A5J4S4K2_9ZZZZ
MHTDKIPSGNDIQIEISNVHRTYFDTTGRRTDALQDVNLKIRKGEFLTLIGSSGCGKTTLLRLIAGLDLPQEGSLLIEGQPVSHPGYERGYVFQQASLFPWKTVEENIATGLKARHIYRAQQVRVNEYIDLVGLNGFSKAYPHEISGGMAQRVAIARALINEPKVLLLDEPLGALDAFTRIDLQNTIRKIRQETGTTIVLVTHDVDEAIFLSDRIAIMTARPGKISEIIPVNVSGERDRNKDEFILLREWVLEKLHLARKPFDEVRGYGEAI